MQVALTTAVGDWYNSARWVVALFDRHAGFVMAVLTATYVIATWVLVRFSKKQLRASVELERSRTRPVIVFDLIIEHYFVHVSLRNLGQTLAQNIKISVEPEIRKLHGGKNLEGVLVDPPDERDEPVPFLRNGVTSLAPGREIKGDIGFVGRFRMHYQQTQFVGSVSYSGPDRSTYCESFRIDLTAESELGHVERYDVHDVAEALKRLKDDVRKIATKLAEP